MCKVSIIIPAYNVSTYIQRCVQSALDQTLTDIEIIVVNDGSTDNTPELLRQFIDARLIIVNKTNGGLSSARRAGLEKVTGEYIYQLDGDDWLEKDALLDMYNMATQKNLDVVIADAYVDDDEGKLSYLEGATSLNADYFQDFMLGKILPNFWTKLYRRGLFFENDIHYNDKIAMGEDILVNIQLFFYAKKVGKINKAYLHYIQRNTSISKVYNQKMYQLFDLMNEVDTFLTKKNIKEKYRLEFECLEYVHTYYYRILVDVKKTDIHKDFYNRGQKKYKQYLNNPYIQKFLEARTLGEQKLERIFRMSYYLGRFRLKMIKHIDKLRNQ